MNKKNILVSPLDWGIGHASRCVPIIKALSKHNVNIFIAAGGRAASFLKQAFPELDHIPLEGYNIHYPTSGNMAISMLRQSPRIMRTIRQENQLLDNIIHKYKIDIVISDNRFGLWSRKAYCVYITHQLRIKAGRWRMFEGLLQRMHNRYINKFNECWIPDIPDFPGLAGELSHTSRQRNTFFIGPLSRFAPGKSHENGYKYDIMAIISGPEPQRGIFEKKVIQQLRDSDLRALIVLGKPEAGMQAISEKRNILVYPHLSSHEMREAMLSSSLILCRPGYSSIMDLSVLGIKAVFVPTPGQTEQEYLARLHQQQGHYYALSQDRFNIPEMMRSSNEFKGNRVYGGQELLDERIKQLIESS